MTTYAYTITIDDSEMIALREALRSLIERCDEHLAKDDRGVAPYLAWKHSAERIQQRLHEQVEQTSRSRL